MKRKSMFRCLFVSKHTKRVYESWECLQKDDIVHYGYIIIVVFRDENPFNDASLLDASLLDKEVNVYLDSIIMQQTYSKRYDFDREEYSDEGAPEIMYDAYFTYKDDDGETLGQKCVTIADFKR